MDKHSKTVIAGMAAGVLVQLCAPQASWAVRVYSATGSGISGSLGSEAFSDASWSLTATADEQLSTLTSFTVPPLGSFNLWSLPVSPRLTIATSGQSLEADLLPSGQFSWLVLSGSFPVGPTPKIGFVYTTPSFNPETAAGVIGMPGSFINLKDFYSVSGPAIFEPFSFPTSAGSLVIANSSLVPGSFRIQPVPSPAPLPLLAVGSALAWSRRLRHRCKQAGRG